MFRTIWFQTKVLQILRNQYDYVPAKFQMGVLNSSSRQMRENGGNEYDAAIAFMLIQVGSLSGETESNEDFITKVVRQSYYCAERALLESTKETADALYAERFERE
jgi:hypothetical protein